jgi:ABC-type lipoprotein release transport system permease subunit
MAKHLIPDDLLTLLRKIDTPTVCNAIEVAQGQRGFDRFTKGTMQHSKPGDAPIVGFARTAKIAGLAAPTEDPAVIRSRRMDYFRSMAAVEEYLSENRSRIVDIVRSYEEQKKRTYSGDIAMVKLLSAVITVLTGVTGLGTVGLAWFSVTQRRKQIGTRRALGATRWDIVRYFMVENWLITSTGLAIGLAGSVGLNWFLDTQYSVGRVPLWYLPVGMLALWVLGQLAVLLPARRAANIPPALATRSV